MVARVHHFGVPAADAWEPHLWREMCCVSEPCERRVVRDRRETASEGPSPAQLTELRLLVHTNPKERFPAASSGSRNRMFLADL